MTKARVRETQGDELLVKKSAAWFLGGFHAFLRPYLRRHFHSIAIDRSTHPAADFASDAPLIVYANHPSWWDPLIAHFLHRALFPQRHFFAPIDSDALEQYSVFEKLGFYGVKLSSTSGAASFLKKSVSILNQPDSAIWITPEGRFADVRDHGAELMPGLSHLCKRSDHAVALPLALEYVFWEERLPVCLVSLGVPLRTGDYPEWSKPDWAKHLAGGLRDAQTRLAELTISRSCEPFDNLLSGTRGGGWVYDSCRRVKAMLTGKSFKAGHGDQFQ
ncbi:lysophospholipid acyltransferase family protein [Stieleria sp. ICT_E10.1]|uniref:lysophospholipid acyltransferase family protein n=1 Tax=Stieleria sedimenti TaxID=2976331 RepID=UPI002180937C|nr:lysophospholipid acyltransferase family protein [Stieleria sedimenti]MCS7470240.1 lysophospholipid acyltransferase family protein [Stieleria sedimenti]